MIEPPAVVRYAERPMTEATARNLRRKARYADAVQLLPGGQPLFSWIDLSVTELCNRSAGHPNACKFCPRIDPAGYPNQALHMSAALAGKIGEELTALDYRGAVAVCGYGEPLLHPNLPQILRELGPAPRVEIVTNGDRLTAATAAELHEAGADYFIVSLYDGPHQLDPMRRAFAEAGLSEDQYILRDRWYGPESDFGLKLTNRAGAVTTGDQPPPPPSGHGCHYPAYELTIDWNGDVLLCVQDWGKKVKFANLNKTSMVDAWLSKAMQKRRMRLLRGDRSDSPCSSCNANGLLHGADHAAAWSRR